MILIARLAMEPLLIVWHVLVPYSCIWIHPKENFWEFVFKEVNALKAYKLLPMEILPTTLVCIATLLVKLVMEELTIHVHHVTATKPNCRMDNVFL